MSKVVTLNITSNIKATLKDIVIDSKKDEKAKQIIMDIRG